MARTSPTTTTIPVRAIGALLTAVVAGAVVLAGPAAAAPHEPTDLTLVETDALDGITLAEPDDDPSDDLLTFVPKLKLDAASECEPEAGVAYSAYVSKGPDRPSVPSVEWTRVGDGSVGAVPELSGFLPFGDGTYELVATVYHPPHEEDGPSGLVSDPVTVTVDCGTDPEDPEDPTGAEDPEDPEDPDDPGTEVEDEIIEAVPTFTG